MVCKLKRTNIFLILVELSLACTLFIDSFIKDVVAQNFLTVIMGSLFLVLVLFFKFESDNHALNSDSIYTIIIFATIYYIAIYLLGLIIGFYKNNNSLEFINIFKNILQAGLFILSAEMFRYMVVIKGKKSKVVLSLLVLVLSLCDTSDLIYKCNFMDISDTINLVGYHVLPSFIKNIMLTYIALKVGYKPAIVYRVIFELPQYFVPIFPNTGLYIQTIINIILPLILFFIFYSTFRKKQKIVFNDRYKSLKTFMFILLISPIIIGIALVSGLFRYYAVSIGSSSMTPNICKGDAVIVKKLSKEELKDLKTGDVLVYKNSGRVIVHRIKDIVEFKGEYYFYTKGDFNNAPDSYYTKQSEVIGVVAGKIPWIGIPTVWLKELANF